MANSNLIIFGLEGSGKSLTTLESTVSGLRPSEFAFYAGISYAALREKQSALIARFGGDERKFPICSLTVTDKNLNYVWNTSNPFRIPAEAKVVLITQSSVSNCNWDKLVAPPDSMWRNLIIDEYSFSSTMVPGYDHQLLALIRDKLPENSISSITKSFKRQVLSKYSELDLAQILARPFEPFFTPHWLKLCAGRNVKVLTSEKLAVLALTSLGFAVEAQPIPDFSDCVVHVHPAQINTVFFEYFNTGKWDQLDFDTIITNRAEGDPRCLNHTIVKGSNSLIGQRVISVVSHVPTSHIKMVTEAISSIGETAEDYDNVFKLFYRDVMCQALGRTLGHRGGKLAHLLISHTIWDAIKDDLASLGVPYRFCDWQIPRDLAIELERVRTLSLAKSAALKFGKADRLDATRMAAKMKIETFVMENFEAGAGFLTYDEISTVFNAQNLVNHNGRTPQPGIVASILKLQKAQRWICGRKANTVEGVMSRR
jgi:hypothetical protein